MRRFLSLFGIGLLSLVTVVFVYDIPVCFGACTLTVGSGPQEAISSGTGVYVVSSSTDTVSVIDSTRNAVVRTISVGDGPNLITKSGTGIFVVNSTARTISIINTGSLNVTKTISTGNGPSYIYASGTGVYVSNRNADTLTIVDTDTDTVIRTVSAGNGPTGMIRNGTGLYIANQDGGNTVSVIDLRSNTLVKSITVGSTPVYVAASGTGVYAANNNASTVSVIDRRSNTVVKTVTVGSNPYFIAAYGTGVYAGNYFGSSVSIIDTTDDILVQTVTTGSNPYFFEFHGTGAYIPNFGSDTISVIDTERLIKRTDISVGDGPRDIAFAGSHAYAVNSGGSSVSVITLTNDTLRNYCVDAVCGDGEVDDPEECDDDNTTDGDGCSSTCTIETGYTCDSDEPSVCVENAICTPLRHYSMDDTDDFVTVNGTFATSTDVPSIMPSNAKSLVFDGSTNSLVATRQIQDDFTICAWLKTTGTGAGTPHYLSMAIVDSQVGGGAADFGFGVDINGKLMFGNGTSDTTGRSSVVVNTGNWVHGCVTRDVSSGEFWIYVNGEQNGSGSGSALSLTANSQIMIGDGTDGAKNWNGKLDDIRIYGYTLSASEIASLYGGSCFTRSSSSSSSTSSERQQSAGGRRSSTRDQQMKSIERSTQFSSSTASREQTTPTSFTQVMGLVQSRTCTRMKKWFSGSPSAFERVNDRILKRLGFSCK